MDVLVWTACNIIIPAIVAYVVSSLLQPPLDDDYLP